MYDVRPATEWIYIDRLIDVVFPLNFRRLLTKISVNDMTAKDYKVTDWLLNICIN